MNLVIDEKELKFLQNFPTFTRQQAIHVLKFSNSILLSLATPA